MNTLLNQLLGALQAPGNPYAPQQFKAKYKAFPVAFANKESLESGDKILLPPTALETLANLKVVYPMMFRITNPVTQQQIHCGVMEFSAPEGMAYLPYWMIESLLVEDGGLISIENVSLPKGTYVKLQPHTISFTQLHNPKAVLEKTLRGFSCLTKGVTIKIIYDKINYYLDVVETRPANAISVVETDCEVEFDPPKDMKDEEAKQVTSQPPPSPDAIAFDFSSAPPVPELEKKLSGTSASLSSSQAASSSAAGASSSSGASYFANLKSTGYTLKSKKAGSPAPGVTKPSATPPPKSSSAASPSPTPKISSSPPAVPVVAAAAAPGTSSLPVPTGRKQIMVREGNFDYIYEVDDATQKKRLLRRIPVPQLNRQGSAPSPNSSSDAIPTATPILSRPASSAGSKPGFVPFAGKGYSLN